jgi:cohesin complex subunit SA-1/2
MNPAAALQGTAEDFLESLTQSPGSAQAEFINLVLRACGCNDSVDADMVLDYDGVVDALDDFTEGLKKVRDCHVVSQLFSKQIVL